MRARIKFDTDSVQDTLVGILKEKKWFYDAPPDQAAQLIHDVRDSVEETDQPTFDAAAKILLMHQATDSRGAMSLEHGIWVARILNANIHQLQMACEAVVSELVEYANVNHKRITFDGPIQIVERKRKETIIEGQTLATPKDRQDFARSQHGLERWIAIGGGVVFLALLAITYPWTFRDFDDHRETWIFSVFEKGIGSVAVTALIAFVQYRVFVHSLRDYTIRWSIPGRPQKHYVKSRGA